MSLLDRRAAVRLISVSGVMCISFAAIFVDLAGSAPTTITFFRAAYALPVLFVLAAAGRRRDTRPRRARVIAVVAGLALAADLTLWHQAIDLIGAGLATVLVHTQVVFVALVAWAAWRERPSSTALWAIPVIFAGIALISGLGSEDAYGDDPVAGSVLAIAAGAAYAAFLLVFRLANRRYLAPVAGPVFDATVGVAVGGLLAGLFTSDFSLSITWPEHGWLVALALLIQTLGWGLIAVGLPRLPALETSLLLIAQPVGALIWARLILDESLSALQFAGVLVVLAGIAAASARGAVRSPRPAASAGSVRSGG